MPYVSEPPPGSDWTYTGTHYQNPKTGEVIRKEYDTAGNFLGWVKMPGPTHPQFAPVMEPEVATDMSPQQLERYLQAGAPPAPVNIGAPATGATPGVSPAPPVSPAPDPGVPPEVPPPPEIPGVPHLGAPPPVTTPMVGEPPPVGEPPAIAEPTLPGEVTAPPVTPAPPYEKTPEQLAWEEMYEGHLRDWVEAGGYGIPDETQQLMAQQLTDALKAREQEQLRVMRNEMARRGLENSGFIFANEQKIRANTTETLARSITDVKIQSELMKVASFERALGAAGQYLGYLSDEAAKAYAPQFATWQAQVQADMAAWQMQAVADLEKWRMEADHNFVAWQLGEQRDFQAWFMQEQAKLTAWEIQQHHNLVAWQTRATAQLAQWQMEAGAQLAQWQMQAEQAYGAWALGAQLEHSAWQTTEQIQHSVWQTTEQLKAQMWAVQQQIQLATWQTQVDFMKFQLGQQYTQQNMLLAHDLSMFAATQQHEWDKELMWMQIEANKQAAGQQAAGSIFGTIVGAVLGK